MLGLLSGACDSTVWYWCSSSGACGSVGPYFQVPVTAQADTDSHIQLPVAVLCLPVRCLWYSLLPSGAFGSFSLNFWRLWLCWRCLWQSWLMPVFTIKCPWQCWALLAGACANSGWYWLPSGACGSAGSYLCSPSNACGNVGPYLQVPVLVLADTGYRQVPVVVFCFTFWCLWHWLLPSGAFGSLSHSFSFVPVTVLADNWRCLCHRPPLPQTCIWAPVSASTAEGTGKYGPTLPQAPDVNTSMRQHCQACVGYQWPSAVDGLLKSHY